MCIICISGRGVRQPNETEIREMFYRNPHGAGYMVAEGGKVRIEKGFMNLNELLRALRWERFGKNDVVVYHFRISTQAGVNAEMTQPFPLTTDLEKMKYTTVTSCPCGVAHNGIIAMTSSKSEHEYSDTALYIAKYLSGHVRRPEHLHDVEVLKDVQREIESKMVLLDGSGDFATIGHFIEDDGLLFSNESYKPWKWEGLSKKWGGFSKWSRDYGWE